MWDVYSFRDSAPLVLKKKRFVTLCFNLCYYENDRQDGSSIPEVFNRGSATPRGSAEVLQGVRQMISSEAFFPSSKNVQRPKDYININRT